MSEKTLQYFNITQFQRDILNWYKKNKRDLPWRQDKDPYKIWVSEIMLQQTKVDTVIPYFNHFMEKYPTLNDLAEADEQEVLKAWEGLGYYSRARNLHNAVREVVSKYDGVVPHDGDDFGSLKGVGPYTRGAVLSIAYDKPEPAIDGNFMRVFSRILKITDDIQKSKTKKLFENYMNEIISKDDPSSFNQAIMDLGATICTPKSPACLFCPVLEHCRAYAEGIQEELPVKSKQKKQKVMRYVVLLMKNRDGKILIEQRPKEGLLASLWQFPMVPIDNLHMDHVENWVRKEYRMTIDLHEKKGNIKHVFSHIKWDLDVYQATVDDYTNSDDHIRFVHREELENYPFPVSHQKMMAFIH